MTDKRKEIEKYLTNERKKGRFNIFIAVQSVAKRYRLSNRQARAAVAQWADKYAKSNNPSGEKSWKRRNGKT